MRSANFWVRPLGGLFAVSALIAAATTFAYDPMTAGNGLTSANVRLANGFDFPVGWPEGANSHKARGYTPPGHLGEDWNGDRGGDTDLGDPIYAVGLGVVVFARDVRVGWGTVVIVRHAFREPTQGGAIQFIDSLYGHLDTIQVREGQQVARGQQIATMGTAHGMYDAHLHFEIRKNIRIGMYRSAFARDFSNYHDPTQFINAHRQLPAAGSTLMALNTFVPYPGGAGLPPAEGAYELGINSPARLQADAASVKLNKSAFAIKRRVPPPAAAPTGHKAFDDLNKDAARSLRSRRYDDLRE